jgi:Carboxypeptidase regulatory-like domain
MFLASRIPALPGALIWCLLVADTAVPAAAGAGRGSASVLAASQATPVPRVALRSGTASIKGKVASSSDAPLGRARIVLTSPALSEPRVALSKADGTYEFVHLPAGAYALSASRSGFATHGYGERRAAPAAPVTLADGQALTGIDFSLLPAGVIVGRILDEDDQPFAGATVDALVPRTEQGQPTLASVATAESDDRGEFRLTGLAAGQYYVSAFDPAFAHVGDETGPLRYSATYYPGVASPDRATPVTVTPGLEPTAGVITIGLKIIRPARVSGRLSAPNRGRLLSGAVIMTHGDAAMTVPSQDAMILPDGTFVFSNVAPGRYEIRARGELVPGATAHFATFRVLVEGRDITDVEMTLLPGATITGTILFEPVKTPKPAAIAGIRVRAPLTDGSTFGDALTGEVLANGSYAIRGVMAGNHLVTVEGLPYPWIVKSVISRGQDITDVGLEADARQRFENVAITLTDAASDVSGVVRDAKGRPAADAMVLVIPLAQQFWHRTSRRFGWLRTDAAGRFRIRGLPEGEYRAVASLDVDENDAFRTAILERLSDAGTPLTLKDLEQRVLDLPLTSPRMGRASTR